MNEAKTLGNFTEKQKQFIRYLGRGKRDIQGNRYTFEQFAEIIGVHWTTLYEWKKLPGLMQEVFEYAVSENIDQLPDMVKAQIAKAKGEELFSIDAKTLKRKALKPGDTPAFLAVMRQFGLLKSDKQDVNQNMSGEVGITIQTVNYKDAQIES